MMAEHSLGEWLLLGADDETVYNWFHHGRGTNSTLDANADRWRAVGECFQQVAAIVAHGLGESQASWTGAAADGAHGSTAPLQTWAQDTVAAALQSSATVHAQSLSFNDTKAALSPPMSVPNKPWFNDVWPGETNYDQALAAKQGNSIRNLELVRSYGASTRANTAAYPRFVEPTVGTTTVGSAAPDSGDVAERGPSSSARHQPIAHVVGDAGAAGSADSVARPVTEPSPAPPEPPGPDIDRTIPSGRAPTGISDLPGQPGGAVDPARAGRSGHQPPALVGEQEGRTTGERVAGGAMREQSGIGDRPGGAVVRGAIPGMGAGGAGARSGLGGPVGAMPASGPREKDDDHQRKFGVPDRHEDFWDDNPAVAPAVIGDDD
jgi:hypothetical protein